ncbi:MAG: hypothetical protein ACLPX5_03110 [Dissulfurispiraceae bacterium]
MADILEKGEMLRLEDFISLAKEGKNVKLSVSLSKQTFSQKVHPGDTEEMRAELDMYMLLADYTFSVGNWVKKVSKIYVAGTVGEPLNAGRQNVHIANERLRMDYKRLKEADIKFEEKYFS